MYAKLSIVVSVTLALLLGAQVRTSAQEVGLFNSPKGIGAAARYYDSPDAFVSAHFYVDIYGVVTSRCSYPGYKLNVSRQYVFARIPRNGYSMTFYAGPGVTAGFVRDHDKGRGWDLVSLTSDNQGWILAVSGDAGCRFDFGGAVALDLSLMAEAGAHFRRTENEDAYTAVSTSIYNNGILQALYPQLTILFKLK